MVLVSAWLCQVSSAFFSHVDGIPPRSVFHFNTLTWELKGSNAPLPVWTGLKSLLLFKVDVLHHWLTADEGVSVNTDLSPLFSVFFSHQMEAMISVRVMMKEFVLRGSAVSWWSREGEAAAAAACVWRGSDWAVLLGGGVERRASSSSDWQRNHNRWRWLSVLQSEHHHPCVFLWIMWQSIISVCGLLCCCSVLNKHSTHSVKILLSFELWLTWIRKTKTDILAPNRNFKGGHSSWSVDVRVECIYVFIEWRSFSLTSQLIAFLQKTEAKNHKVCW